MIKVRSQNKKMFIDCVGMYITDSESDLQPNYCIKGVIATTGQHVVLGYYNSKKGALDIIGEILEESENLDYYDMPKIC